MGENDMEINERVKRQLDNLCYDNAFLKLKEICTKKAKEKNISLQENDRLNYELDLIEKWGFAKDYLFGLELIAEINEFAFILTENNSYVNYILGITSVNSCLYNLPFERYFNEYKALLPKYVIYTPKTKKTQLLKSLYQKLGNRLVRSKR